MATLMQGPWTITVKSKSAARPQRFVVAGAASGSGTYAGETSTGPVPVEGDSWSIRIQSKKGSTWTDSVHRIKFPTASGGVYRFDIESNDPGPDTDFNDLILTCSTPQTGLDFLVYGNVETYSGFCSYFNPCRRHWVVIDTLAGFREALLNPVLAKAIKLLYPQRVLELPPDPLIDANALPFRPVVLPLHQDNVMPTRQAQVLRISPRETGDAKGESVVGNDVTTLRLIDRDRAVVRGTFDYDRVAIASIIDRIRLRCDVDDLPGVAIRFQEYDRTAAEIAGQPYTGDGDREDLGVTVTDVNGNYVFRFRRTLEELFDEGLGDLAPGEAEVVQAMPDLIAQLLDPMATGGYSWESAPYWNIPLLKRIDLCIPASSLGAGLRPCDDDLIIQSIGNVLLGALNPAPFHPPSSKVGTRTGFNNYLGTSGKITAKNTDAPKTECAAWTGTLDLYACLNHKDIKYYTIRYRRLGEANWQFFQQTVLQQREDKAGIIGYNGDPVGPFDINLSIDGTPVAPHKGYKNVEVEPGWVNRFLQRKARIASSIYENGTPGPIQFRIEGYRANGSRFPDADDTVTLYIDNQVPTRLIDENVTMAGATLGNCALLTLPADDAGAPLTVSFKADQKQGFLSSYGLYMLKGATGSFPVEGDTPAPPYLTRAYQHVDDLACARFDGTFDDPTVDPVTGFVSVDLVPKNGSAWLEPNQNFCAFSIRLTVSKRATNGYTHPGPWEATPVLIGIERPE